MQLSEHFTLEEFTFSQTAARKGIDNDPPATMYLTLKRTAAGMEQVRSLLGAPIKITSAYRCLSLNAAIGSKNTSQHTKGEAVDFTCAVGDPKTIVARIMSSDIKFDQLICEFDSWTHISVTNQPGAVPRKQALIIDKSSTRIFT